MKKMSPSCAGLLSLAIVLALTRSAGAQAISGGTRLSEIITTLFGAAVRRPATCPPPDGTRPDPTLVNTDAFVLSRFPLARVYQQLLTLSGASAQRPVDVYQQMWDSLDLSTSAKFDGPHCDDRDATINGFPVDCPRTETTLKRTEPSVFSPVALFNRFDLSAADGSHCGEFRIVYALTPPLSAFVFGRDFIIFEGVLPNPNPKCGVEACRPVVDFWEGLAAIDAGTAVGQRALADSLEKFYFAGLTGFEPVVHPQHYGAAGGQIRTNMFSNFVEWQLREFHLSSRCDEGGQCRQVLEPVTVKTNPYNELFKLPSSASDARASIFQTSFPAQVKALSNDAVAQISFTSEDRFNAGQSTSQDANERYEVQFGSSSVPNTFGDAISAELGNLGRSDLTPADIVRRATTQSCAGCHQLSNGVALGGKLNPTWPSSRNFVHVDESGFLSPALWCDFLPARKSVLDGFASSPARACSDQPEIVPPVVVVDRDAELPVATSDDLTISGRLAGSN